MPASTPTPNGPPAPTPSPNHSAPPPPNEPGRTSPRPSSSFTMRQRVMLTGLLVVLFAVGMGLRVWMARRQRAEREAMFRSLAAVQRETDRRIAEQRRAEMNEEMRRSIERLKAMGDRIVVPPPIAPVTAGNGAAKDGTKQGAVGDGRSSAGAGSSRHNATEMPAGLVVAAADIAWQTIRQAPAKDFRDRTAKRELEASLGAVHADIAAAAAAAAAAAGGGEERFGDYARVASHLGSVEAALGRVEATMKPGTYRTMAIRNITDLRDELRDFRDGAR